jgi:DNA-directed RNA polymerase subunit F
MPTEQTKDIVARLIDAFPQTAMREQTVAIYTARLNDLDNEAASQAVDDLIETSTTFPTIAEVRNLVAEVALGLPTAEQAYASIFDRDKKAGEIHDLTRHVADIFGGFYNVRTSENPSIIRSQFLKTYAEFRQEEIGKANLSRLRMAA